LHNVERVKKKKRKVIIIRKKKMKKKILLTEMGSNKKSLRPTRRRSMKGKYSFQRDDDEGVVFVWLGKADDVDEGIEAES